MSTKKDLYMQQVLTVLQKARELGPGEYYELCAEVAEKANTIAESTALQLGSDSQVDDWYGPHDPDRRIYGDLEEEQDEMMLARGQRADNLEEGEDEEDRPF